MMKKILAFLFCVMVGFQLLSCEKAGEKGEKGDQGVPGEKGEPGEPGKQGEPGEAGKDGSIWLVGEADPESTTGVDGDMYLNTTSFDIFLNVRGTWVKQGNIRGGQGEQGETGKDADPNTLAYVLFTDSDGTIAADPVIVEKGQTIELPTLDKYGYEFLGWRHNYTTITSETPIEESMTLVAKWQSKLELSLDTYNEYYVGEEIYFEGYYSQAIYRDIVIDSIVYNGVTYTEADVEESANLILDFYTDYSPYSEDNETYYDGYLVFGKAGDYTVNFRLPMTGATSSLSLTIKEENFPYAMSVGDIQFVSDFDYGIYHNNDEVTLFDELNRPEAMIEMDIVAPKVTNFVATLNGADVESVVYNYNTSNSVWTIRFGNTAFDETLDTHVFEVVATSEVFGSVTGKLTVKLAARPEGDVTTLMSNTYTDVLVYDPYAETSYDDFVQTIQLHSTYASDELIVTTVLKSADDIVVANVTINTTTDGVASVRSIVNSFSLDSYNKNLAVGEYTLTTTISTVEGVLMEIPVTFNVAPNWDSDEAEYDMFYTDVEFEVDYIIDDVLTAITLQGVDLSTEEFTTFIYDSMEFSAKFTVSETNTTLTIKGVGFERNANYDDAWLSCVVSNAEFSYETHIISPYFYDGEEMRLEGEFYFGMYAYALETYFAEDILVEDSSAQKLYAYFTTDTSNMTLTEYIAYYEGEEGYQLYEAFMKEMSEKPLPLDVTLMDYVEAARTNVLENSGYPEEFIQSFDGMMFYPLFRDDYWLDASGTYTDLLDLGMSEALYFANDGLLIVEMMYLNYIDVEDWLDYINQWGDEEYMLEYLMPVYEGRLAYYEAKANGVEDLSTYAKTYRDAMIGLLVYLETGYYPIYI